MHNSMVVFAFSVLDLQYHFGQICSKETKLSVKAETWYLYLFNYAEFKSEFNFSVFNRKYFFGQT